MQIYIIPLYNTAKKIAKYMLYILLAYNITTHYINTLIVTSDMMAAHRLDRHSIVVQGVPEPLNAIVEPTDLKRHIYTATTIILIHIQYISCIERNSKVL